MGQKVERGIERVVTIDGYHEEHVQKACKNLRNKNYIILRVTKVKKMFLWIFGEDITEIEFTKLH